MKIDLEHVSPMPSSFTLKRVPEKTFHIRPVALADRIWMNHTFGDRLQSIMRNLIFEELSRMVFHQLVLDDQTFFTKKTIQFVNEEGETCEGVLGGVKMLQTLVESPKEAYDIVMALMKAIGVSEPLLEALEKEELEKKSREEAQSQNQTGAMSSTSLPPNTAGQQTS